MRIYHYKTTFDAAYRPFYVYSRSSKPSSRTMGTIPAGIDITYKGKHLSTIAIMQLIHKLSRINNFPIHLIVYDMKAWYTPKNKINKPFLYQFVKELEDLVPVPKT